MKTFVLAFCALIGTANAKPMKFFRPEDAVTYENCVKSIRNAQRGELYTLRWDNGADYHTDRMFASGCASSIGMIGWACTNVLDHAPIPQVVTALGCSAFAATNALGQPLVGRNFDYRYRMSHALVYVPRNATLDRPYASVSTVDAVRSKTSRSQTSRLRQRQTLMTDKYYEKALSTWLAYKLAARVARVED